MRKLEAISEDVWEVPDLSCCSCNVFRGETESNAAKHLGSSLKPYIPPCGKQAIMASSSVLEYENSRNPYSIQQTAIALLNNRTLASITNAEVRQVLEQTKQLPRIYGRADQAEAARLSEFEIASGASSGAIASLKN